MNEEHNSYKSNDSESGNYRTIKNQNTNQQAEQSGAESNSPEFIGISFEKERLKDPEYSS